MVAEKLAPTGIRYADRPVRSQSLYRLHYPSPLPKRKLISTSWPYNSRRPDTPYREHLERDVEVLATCCVIMARIQSMISKNRIFLFQLLLSSILPQQA